MKTLQHAFLLLIFSPCMTMASSVSTTGDTVSRSAWGGEIVTLVTQSFNNSVKSDTCSAKPDYYCNGLMVSAFESGDDTYWMHNSDKKLSLTYFRNDIVTKLFGSVGYILFPENLIQEAERKGLTKNSFKQNFRCIFPMDGVTGNRIDDGCGTFVNYPEERNAPCQTHGITTADKWISAYVKDNYVSIPETGYCGFSLDGNDTSDKTIFAENIKTQKYLIANKVTGVPQSFPWNEVVMKIWSADAPARVPVMALFYVNAQSYSRLVMPKKGAKEVSVQDAPVLAKTQQKNYYDTTGIFIPIIKISLASNSVTFTYSDDDQAPEIPDQVKVYPE